MLVHYLLFDVIISSLFVDLLLLFTVCVLISCYFLIICCWCFVMFQSMRCWCFVMVQFILCVFVIFSARVGCSVCCYLLLIVLLIVLLFFSSRLVDCLLLFSSRFVVFCYVLVHVLLICCYVLVHCLLIVCCFFSYLFCWFLLSVSSLLIELLLISSVGVGVFVTLVHVVLMLCYFLVICLLMSCLRLVHGLLTCL